MKFVSNCFYMLMRIKKTKFIVFSASLAKSVCLLKICAFKVDFPPFTQSLLCARLPKGGFGYRGKRSQWASKRGLCIHFVVKTVFCNSCSIIQCLLASAFRPTVLVVGKAASNAAHVCVVGACSKARNKHILDHLFPP